MSEPQHQSSSAEIRKRLSHPIIDGDGHVIEFVPAVLDYLKDVAGTRVVERYVAFLKHGPAHSFSQVGQPQAVGWHGLTPAERRAKRVTRPSFWIFPASATLDRATAMLPGLLRQRLDDLGLDYLILYPTLGIHIIRHPDEELRRAGVRAINRLHADLFREHADRMTPAAVIPMHSPAEAIEELEFAVGKLGLKVAMIGGCVARPVDEVARTAPELARYGFWIDNLGLESAHDYDSVWAKFVEMKVAITAHGGSMGWGTRASTGNFTFNHIGHFAAAHEALCKALVLSGIAQRFPELNFAFLEGGAGWASDLYNHLIEHWDKRNRSRLLAELDPRRVDTGLLAQLFESHAPERLRRHVTTLRTNNGNEYEPAENLADIDDWVVSGINKAEDIRDLFMARFFFGCEADDRTTAVAFDRRMNRFGVRLNAMFGSDIGHFDVRDMTGVVAEAYELVNEGLIDEADFRAFTFENAVRLHAGMNPDFFKGTAVETAVVKLKEPTA